MLFILHKKPFSFSKYLNFCLDILVMQKNGLIRKVSSISKFITSQPGKQTIAILLLHNISRSKHKQTMKFGQFIECKKETFFLKNYVQSELDKLFSDLFLKNTNCSYLWINSLKFYTGSFCCMPSRGLSKDIENKLQMTCFYLI